VAPLALAVRPRIAVMRWQGECWLPAPREEVFHFFTDASKLEQLSPPWVHFRLLTPQPIAIRAGTTLDYRMRIYAAPIRWRSEITEWDPPIRFVDEQKRGPLRRWVHTHTFRSERGGTVVSDDVCYEVPLAFLAGWLVRRDVEKIFEYRRAALRKIFDR